MLAWTSSNAQAVGFGANLGLGSEAWKHESSTRENRGFLSQGFVFDGYISGERPVNYQVIVGLERNAPYKDGLVMSGYMMTHAVGLWTLSRNDYRLWTGLQLKAVHYNSLEDDSDNQYRGTINGMGIGPAVGYKLNMGRLLTLGLSGGLQVMGYRSNYRASNSEGYTGSSSTTANAITGYFNLSILFRVHHHDY